MLFFPLYFISKQYISNVKIIRTMKEGYTVMMTRDGYIMVNYVTDDLEKAIAKFSEIVMEYTDDKEKIAEAILAKLYMDSVTTNHDIVVTIINADLDV